MCSIVDSAVTVTVTVTVGPLNRAGDYETEWIASVLTTGDVQGLLCH